ncbi:hypothetical protein BGZ94_000555, partial [Podila epigama]
MATSHRLAYLVTRPFSMVPMQRLFTISPQMLLTSTASPAQTPAAALTNLPKTSPAAPLSSCPANTNDVSASVSVSASASAS